MANIQLNSLIVEDDTRRGIVSMLIGVFFFTLMSVCAKHLSNHNPVLQVVFFRCLFALVPSLIMVTAAGGIKTLRTERFGGHIFRALVGTASMICLFYAFHLLPLADAVAINFSGPLFVTLFAVLILKEPVGLHRWTALIIGLVGVLIMVQPGTNGATLIGGVVALSSAVFNGLAMTGVRSLGRTEPSTTTVFYFTLISTLLTLPTLPFVWQPPAWQDFLLLGFNGILAGLGQIFMTRAYQHAPAAIVSPFNYSAVLWATAFGYVVWGDVPGRNIFFGAVIVIAAGIYIVYRETVVLRRKAEIPDREPTEF